MDRLSQQEINEAFLALAGGREAPEFARVVEAIRDGVITVTVTRSRVVLTLAADGPVVEFAARLQQLRARADNPSHASIAAHLGVSESAVIRALHGQVLASWASVHLLVQFLGGDPDEYRADWEKARDSRGRRA